MDPWTEDGLILTRDADLARRVGDARWCRSRRAWSWPATAAFWRRVREARPDARDERLDQLVEARRKAREVARAGGVDYPHDTEPWPHQRAATVFAAISDAALLHVHMGGGKTKIALDACRLRGHRRVLVVAPKAVVRVWEAEVRKHARSWARCWPLVEGSVADRARRMRAALVASATVARAAVVVVNYEAVWRPPLAEVVRETTWDALVLDESARVKAPGGRASRFLAAVRAGHRLALTGTPMPHSPLDVYAQYRALDPGIFGLSFARFRDRYAVIPPRMPFPRPVGWRNLDDLARRMDEIRWEVREEEMSLPPLVQQTVPVALEADARRVYDQMEAVFVAQVRDGVVTAANAAVAALRLQQITGGWVKPEGKDEPRRVSRAKRETLEDLVRDWQEPVVVYCRFHADLDDAREALEATGRRVAEVSGRRNDYAAWSEGKADAAVVQVRAGGLGVDLSRAGACVFWSLSWSLGAHDQCVARLRRPPRRSTVRAYYLVARETIDETILRAIEARREVVEAVLDEYRRRGDEKEETR